MPGMLLLTSGGANKTIDCVVPSCRSLTVARPAKYTCHFGAFDGSKLTLYRMVLPSCREPELMLRGLSGRLQIYSACMGFVKVYEAFAKVHGKRCGEQWDHFLPSSILDPGSVVRTKTDRPFGFYADI